MVTVTGRVTVGSQVINPTADVTLPAVVTTGYPSASNTGVPAGTTLTAYTGPANITTAGTVIENKTITKGLIIKAGANNVIIRKCRFTVSAFWMVLNDEGATGLLIEDCEFDGQQGASGDSAVSGRNYTLRRCNIHHTVDGVKCNGANTLIEDNYIHDLDIEGSDPHNDGIQCLDTTGLTIRHNTIILKNGATSCVILSTGSADDMRNVLIEDNLFAGGAYVVYGGYQAGVDVLSRVSNIRILNNKISTVTFAKGGGYGVFTSVSSPVVVSGNTWYDGPKVGQAVS